MKLFRITPVDVYLLWSTNNLQAITRRLRANLLGWSLYVTVDLPYGTLEKCEDFCYWFGPENRCILPHILWGAKVADIVAILGAIDVGSEQAV